MPPCDGLPRYSNAALGYVEEFSFRAEFLRDCEEILGEDLLERGYETMTAEEMGAYGMELLGRAETYAREQGIAMDKLETDDEESPQFKLDVMLAAGRWCRFWAERGHILDPYW